jgi:hypothetical protein
LPSSDNGRYEDLVIRQQASMTPEQSVSLQLAFFALTPDGSEIPLLTVRQAEEPLSSMQEGVRGAMDVGGVWDYPQQHFYPWHAISRAEWITDQAGQEAAQPSESKVLIEPFAEYQAREDDVSFWDTLDRLVNVSANSKLARSRQPSPAARLKGKLYGGAY